MREEDFANFVSWPNSRNHIPFFLTPENIHSRQSIPEKSYETGESQRLIPVNFSKIDEMQKLESSSEEMSFELCLLEPIDYFCHLCK